MALVSKEKFDPLKVQKLAELLALYQEKGQPIDYEIVVDGLKVVRRSSDPAMFFIFENFITPETKSLEVIFYNGASNVNEKRMFTFAEEVPSEKGLSGIEVDARIQEQVEKQKREWEYQLLKKECEDLREEVKELEGEVERLETANKDLVNNQSPFKGFLGEIGSSFVESFIRRNPKILQEIPGGQALAGLINTDNAEKISDENHHSEVSFQAKSNREEDQAAITFVNQLKNQFAKDEFDKILLILQTLADDKTKIDLILNHINIKQQ